MPDLGMIPKATTVVAAAMETAGATIQSEMLDYVSSASGMTLAGALYLIAIVSALIVFASGGNYRWGRYLLIGPSLFFFLVTIRTESDGTEWSFGKKEFSQEAVTKALRGVDTPSNGGGTSVSLVYHFWNVFMSEISQELIKLLNLEESDAQFNFIQKVERYMSTWNLSQIKDTQLRSLIKFTLSSQCKDYFHHLRVANDPKTLEPDRLTSRALVPELAKRTVLVAQKEGLSDFMTPQLYDWMKERNMLGVEYNCQSMWVALLYEARRDVADSIEKVQSQNLQPEQDDTEVRKTFQRKIQEHNDKYTGAVNSEFLNGNASALYAIDWVVARSLYLEINGSSQDVHRGTFGQESSLFQNGNESFVGGRASAYNEDSAGAIQQFNITDKYAERSEFVTAALSLPYYQGLGFLLLSASYPFFAMMVLLPGRALNFFSWLGLWAWLKLWDVGFAVVMFIDNMLYSMLPRGPNIEPKEMENAGLAWIKLLETDPNYSQAIYYNLIATCMFAVPLVTAFFVKGGGGELVNLINQNWQGYSSRVAGGQASFARSIQAQGFMSGLQREKDSAMRIAGVQADAMYASKWSQQVQDQSTNVSMAEAKLGKTPLSSALKVKLAEEKAKLQSLAIKIEQERRAFMLTAGFKVDTNQGRWAANRAVASKYYSHDFVSDGTLPYNAMMRATMGSQYYNNSHVYTETGNQVLGAFNRALDSAGGKVR